MIVIDGHASNLQVDNFANLEEILVKVMEEEVMDNRIVTDILLNDAAFSEIYPHQAEDIESSEIKKVEICSVSVEELASDVTEEMHKVITLMRDGGKRVASLLRKAEIANALEVLQDVIDVTRDFLGIVALLRFEFSINRDNELYGMTDRISDVLEEMGDMLNTEDWLLLADLAEYEFIPICDAWSPVLVNLAQDIAQRKAA